MAYNLELHIDTRSDTYTKKEISTDTAFADPAVVPVRIFYRFRSVAGRVYSCGKLHNAPCNGGCRNSDTGFRRVAVGFGKCYNEFGRGICKGKNFGNVKIAFDVSCVVLAMILSLLLFDFTIVGIREGTVISALCTGLAVKLFQRLTNEPVNRLVSD